jgi:hypothetical protein
MRGLLLAFAIIVTPFSHAATITVKDNGYGCMASAIAVSGEINTGDFSKFINALKQLTDKYGREECTKGLTYVSVNSEGGSVDEAIRIGEEIRKNNLGVMINKEDRCYSSCVFILAGATDKIPLGRVGIHRPYISKIKEGNQYADVRKSRDSASQKIRLYLSSVDVPESLLDEMLSYSPEHMKILSSDELFKFRLAGKDATREELDVASIANYYNITSAEYRKRDIRFRKACSQSTKGKFDKSRAEICMESVMLNISESEAENRLVKVKQMCSQLDYQQQQSCKKKYLVDLY